MILNLAFLYFAVAAASFAQAKYLPVPAKLSPMVDPADTTVSTLLVAGRSQKTVNLPLVFPGLILKNAADTDETEGVVGDDFGVGDSGSTDTTTNNNDNLLLDVVEDPGLDESQAGLQTRGRAKSSPFMTRARRHQDTLASYGKTISSSSINNVNSGSSMFSSSSSINDISSRSGSPLSLQQMISQLRRYQSIKAAQKNLRTRLANMVIIPIRRDTDRAALLRQLTPNQLTKAQMQPVKTFDHRGLDLPLPSLKRVDGVISKS